MSKVKKLKHGGKRDGAGAKPKFEGDKVIALGIYPRKSHVDLLGRPLAKSVALTAIEKAYLKKNEGF